MVSSYLENFRRGGGATITLFEAASGVDSGRIYIQKHMEFDGSELIEELRQKQAACILDACEIFLAKYPEILKEAREQSGEASYYRKRTPEDSELDVNKSIREQFNLLRVVDNERYPAYFFLQGKKYILKVFKG